MNNQIKKALTLILTFCLLLAISCVAFADTSMDGDPTTRALAHCENGRVLVTRDTRYETNMNHMEIIEMSADTSAFMSTILVQFAAL